MPLLPFISVASVLKLWAGWRSFFLLVEKTLQHIKKPLAFSHSLLRARIPTYRTLWSPLTTYAGEQRGEKSACLNEGRGPLGRTAIKFLQNNERIVHINFGQTNTAVCDEVRANNRSRLTRKMKEKHGVRFSPASASIAGSHFPREGQLAKRGH